MSKQTWTQTYILFETFKKLLLTIGFYAFIIVIKVNDEK